MQEHDLRYDLEQKRERDLRSKLVEESQMRQAVMITKVDKIRQATKSLTMTGMQRVEAPTGRTGVNLLGNMFYMDPLGMVNVADVRATMSRSIEGSLSINMVVRHRLEASRKAGNASLSKCGLQRGI